MDLKLSLIVATAVAVVSDTMLVPFYPQFFADTFGVTSPQHIGAYLAAMCFAVMLAFPFWAFLAKKVPTLNLLLYTQFAAGALSIACYWSSHLLVFWLVSLSMIVFKGSYLLVYPYIMSLEDKSKHAGTIGLLSVIVHLGGIAGALLGGMVLQVLEPRHVFLVMALGDFFQMLVCFLSIRSGAAAARGEAPPPDAAPEDITSSRDKGLIYKLGLVMSLCANVG